MEGKIMKVTPVKNYKIPLFAAGMTAIMLASAATGCADPKRIRRDVPDKADPTTRAVDIAGDIQVVDPTDDPVQLDGEVADTVPTDDLDIAGGMVCLDPSETPPTAFPITGDKASSK